MTVQDLKTLLAVGFLWVVLGTIVTFGVMNHISNSPDPQWMMYHQGFIKGEDNGKAV